MSVDVRAGTGSLPLPTEVDEVDLVPVRTYWQLVRQRFLRHRLAVIAVVVLAILIAMSIVVPLATGDAYQKSSLTLIDEGPSLQAPLGYNEIGQNIFLRLAKATQTSLIVGFAAVFLIGIIGAAVGSVAGYFGGWVDNLLMRLVDILMAFPGILLAIALTAVLGPGLDHVILALCLIGWTGYARLVRGEILSLREREFVQAAYALGCPPKRIIARHLLPNLLPPLFIQATFGLAAAIVAEGSLSFLGLGVEPPTPSWGSMLSDGRQFLLVAPHITTYPGLTLMMTVLALNLVGDTLQDRLAGKK